MFKIKRRKIVIFVGLAIVLIMGVLLFSPAHTEPILDAEGEVVPGSIAVMEKIKLGGVEQWIVIRGKNKDKPVLLLLSGGPGASEMGRFIKYNNDLENDFVVVNWEQRGCGKSFPAVKNKEEMKLQQYVSDIKELTEYLKKRFDQEKIYLLGHSWGTIIGTKAIQKYPEDFHAYIGTAQMINVQETDKYMYNYVLRIAGKLGKQDLVKKLEAQGEPPYFGEDLIKKYRLFLTKYAGYYKKENPFPEKNTEWYSLSSTLFINEYNALDKIKYIRGFLNTFPLIYPQLQDIDFVKQASNLQVPVYYMIGRHDYTARFIEEYFERLKAPEKEIFWFENSAHGVIWTEPDKFHDIMVNEVLKK